MSGVRTLPSNVYMPHHASTALISLVSGTVISFSSEIPVSGFEAADRIGIAGIAVWLIYWMLNSFSKRLDRLTASIDKLSEHVKKE